MGTLAKSGAKLTTSHVHSPVGGRIQAPGSVSVTAGAATKSEAARLSFALIGNRPIVPSCEKDE